MYTKEELKQQLRNVGLTGKETILIHSSMKAIGEVEGGADIVLDAWMEYFAEGLLLLPTHTWANVNAQHPVYDYRNTPSCVGLHPFFSGVRKKCCRISGRRGRT